MYIHLLFFHHFICIVIAIILAIKARKATLGIFLLIGNSLYLLFFLFILYFAINYTFKV